MKILGIETSCDETAAAVVDVAAGEILSNQVHTQQEHADYGGVVPEIAARAHMERLPHLVKEALKQANLTLNQIDGIAATAGPGLLGGLLVGTSFAKSLALGAGKPFMATNHLEGHALTAHLTDKTPFPYLLLLVSGGHCVFVNVAKAGEYEELGGTLDDAVGECFDKVAKLMELPMPGGPNVEKLAEKGNPNAYPLPFPLNNKSLDFSFSGLKTAVRNLLQGLEARHTPLSQQQRADVAASFQHTVKKILVKKAHTAVKNTQAERFVLAGGVAANKLLRSGLEEMCVENGVKFSAPPLGLCTDNAVMIAYAGGLRLLKGQKTGLNSKATPRWPLNQLN